MRSGKVVKFVSWRIHGDAEGAFAFSRTKRRDDKGPFGCILFALANNDLITDLDDAGTTVDAGKQQCGNVTSK